MTKIFISYRSGDESFAAVLLDQKLGERFGPENVFRDSRSVQPGSGFEWLLWRCLIRSEVLVVVIGPRWLTGADDGANQLTDEKDFVRREIALALQVGVRVVPVLVGDTTLPDERDLPDVVKRLVKRQYLRLHARNVEYGVRRLVDELASMLGGPESGAGRDGPHPRTGAARVGAGSGTTPC
jgi:TIR domain